MTSFTRLYLECADTYIISDGRHWISSTLVCRNYPQQCVHNIHSSVAKKSTYLWMSETSTLMWTVVLTICPHYSFQSVVDDKNMITAVSNCPG